MSRRLLDFFVEEATEYLDKLEPELARGQDADLDLLRRLSRALRGSARMADQEEISDIAGAVQTVVTEAAGGDRAWDAELHGRVRGVVGELRTLVAGVHEPPPDLEDRARALIERLGIQTAKSPPAAGDRDQFRRYVGGELRSLATDIAEAIDVLERDPRNRDPLKQLLRRVRPLRGVKGVDDIPAVGPALVAVEEVILRIADTSATVGPGHLVLFKRARQALEEVAANLERGLELTEVAAAGPEIEEIKEQVLDAEGQREITWISEMFPEGPGPHMEACPMAERGAGSWEAFFALEATGSLDTAERLRAEMARDGAGARQVGQRLALTFRQLRERAVTFGHPGLGRVARRAAAAIRAQLDAPAWRLQTLASDLSVTIAGLRGYLEGDDPEARQGALARAEESLEGATHPLTEPPVPIESLTYSRDAALARALELRDELNAALHGHQPNVRRARELLTELFGLIEHARDAGG